MQVDSSRYGLEDFEEIAGVLARPLAEFGTPQPMLAALWSAGAAFVAQDCTRRTEYLCHALVHFAPGLSAATAASALKKLGAGAPDEVRAVVLYKPFFHLGGGGFSI